jgi:hypothetical protein
MLQTRAPKATVRTNQVIGLMNMIKWTLLGVQDWVDRPETEVWTFHFCRTSGFLGAATEIIFGVTATRLPGCREFLACNYPLGLQNCGSLDRARLG